MSVFGTSWDDPRTMALLSAAQGLASNRSLGRGLLSGAQAYGGSLLDARREEQKRALLQAQIDEAKAQARQRRQAEIAAQAKAAEALRQHGLLRDALQPVQPIEANAASGVTGPRPEALATVGQRRPIDYQALIAEGIAPDTVEALSKAANYGRQKVARVEDAVGPDGRKVRQQLDDYGTAIGPALPQYMAPEKTDAGGEVLFTDPVTRQILATIRKTQTPDSIAGNAVTMRGQNMTDARAREALAQSQRQHAETASSVEYKQDAAGNWIALPKKPTHPGAIQPIPVASSPKRVNDARNALALVDEAERLVDDATSSYIGAGRDLAGRVVGYATDGAEAGARLQVLEGALVMSQPRMEGPQSDKDTALYRQMAGRIGDPTVPAAAKREALKTIRALHQRYAAQATAPTAPWAAPQQGSTGGFKILGVD